MVDDKTVTIASVTIPAGTITAGDELVVTVHRPGHVMVPAEVEFDDSLNRLGWLLHENRATVLPKVLLKEIIEQWVKDHEVGK